MSKHTLDRSIEDAMDSRVGAFFFLVVFPFWFCLIALAAAS